MVVLGSGVSIVGFLYVKLYFDGAWRSIPDRGYCQSGLSGRNL